MTEFVRSVHEHIKDLFILDIEEICDVADNLKYHIPDSLRESEFHVTLGSIHVYAVLVMGRIPCMDGSGPAIK